MSTTAQYDRLVDMLQAKTPQEVRLDSVDPSDHSHMIAAVSQSYSRQDKRDKDYAMEMWTIGCLIVRAIDYHGSLNISELSVATGYSRGQLSSARDLARHFDLNQFEFEKAWASLSGRRTWTRLLAECGVRTRKSRRTSRGYQKICNRITREVQEAKTDSEKLPLLLENLELVRRTINRHLPLSLHLDDEDYIRYLECACCGEPAPDEGHTLGVTEGLARMHYPICQRCIDDGMGEDDVKWKSVAEQYATYARNIEQEVLSI